MWYFIKNNFKLIYRSRVIFFMFILLPVVLVALLSDTFSNFLDTNKKLDSFQAGYFCEEGSFMEPMITQFQQACEESGIALVALQEKEGISKIKEGRLDTYVLFQKTDYALFQGKDTTGCAMVLDNMITSFINGFRQLQVGEIADSDVTVGETNLVKAEHIDVEPIPNAKTYYGIVEILYMMWCGIISIGAIYMSENKHNVQKRYYISTIRSFRFYLGKLLAGFFALCIQMGTAIAITMIFIGVDWGDVFYKSAGLLLLQAVAVSALSILLYQMLRNTAVVLAIEFFVVFIFGFLGGSFQTYFYSTISLDVAEWSPQYYFNRTIVEFATKGKSDYTYMSIGILLGIILMCSVCSLILLRKRREA